MNNIFFHKKASGLLSLAALAVMSNGLPAVAQSVDTTSTQEFTQSSESEAFSDQVNAEVEPNNQNNLQQTSATSTLSVENTDSVPSFTPTQQFTAVSSQESNRRTVVPVPGTTETSSAALAVQQPQPTSQPSTQSSQSSANDVAQADISVGQPTRGGSSYIGIAGNIGLGGDSALGDGNFMVISKVGITNSISVRPAAVLGDNTVFTIPVTYDFSFEQLADPFSEPLPIAPYVGAGVAIETGDGSDFSFLVTGGVDYPLNSQFTVNAAVNAAFFDETDVGLSIGVGYNFGL